MTSLFIENHTTSIHTDGGEQTGKLRLATSILPKKGPDSLAEYSPTVGMLK